MSLLGTKAEYSVTGEKSYKSDPMISYTRYLTFRTKERRRIIRLTDEVRDAVKASGVREGYVMVSAMHITASVFINDDEEGFRQDLLKMLDSIAPYGHHPDGQGYKHNLTGEDNGDAHMKNMLIGHQVIVPITDGDLDLGPWQEIFYGEWDGMRPKRLIIKVLGFK